MRKGGDCAVKARAGSGSAVADETGQLPAVALPTSADCSNGHQWVEAN